MEYLAVIGISLFLIIPMTIVFFQQSSSLENDITATQLEKIGLEIIDSAEEVYYMGEPTQKQIVIYIPKGVHNIYIYPEEILFNYTSPQSSSLLSLTTQLPLNLTGSIQTYQGKHTLYIRAQTNHINISEVS
jgi:hypothetical protein